MTDRLHALAPSNEDLISLVYDEGLLPEEEREHLAQCPICQQRLADYKDMNTLMLSHLYRSLCPSAVNLNYYCLGGLPVEERTSIANHLLDCPLCAGEVVEIRREQASYDLFPEGGFSLRDAVRRIFANLVVQQAQPVLRDVQPSTGWPRQYRAEANDLSLHLSRADNGEIMLLGIITSSDPAKTLNAFEGMTVDLYTAPGPLVEGSSVSSDELGIDKVTSPLFSTTIDEIGNIFFEEVPPGNYVMILHLADQEVIIEGLTIDHG
jgi:hypothetical protein